MASVFKTFTNVLAWSYLGSTAFAAGTPLRGALAQLGCNTNTTLVPGTSKVLKPSQTSKGYVPGTLSGRKYSMRFILRGTIVDGTYGTLKDLPGIYLPFIPNNIRSYLLLGMILRNNTKC